MHGESLNERTARIHEICGDIDVPMTGRGKKQLMHE